MNTRSKSIAVFITVSAIAVQEVLNHGQDKLPHLPEGDPAPVLMPRRATFVTSAESLPQNFDFKEFLAQLVTQTRSGNFHLT